MRPGLGVAFALTGVALAGGALAAVETLPSSAINEMSTVISAVPDQSPVLSPRVFAVVGEHLVSGGEQGGWTLRLADQTGAFVCIARHGEATRRSFEWRLACSDGTRVTLFTGRRSDRSLVFDVRAKTAAKRLDPPPGYVLVAEGRNLRLRRAVGQGD